MTGWRAASARACSTKWTARSDCFRIRARFSSPPARYAASLELPAPVQETEPLLFAAKRLMLELAGYLAMKQAGVTQLRVGTANTRTSSDTRVLSDCRRRAAMPVI